MHTHETSGTITNQLDLNLIDTKTIGNKRIKMVLNYLSSSENFSDHKDINSHEDHSDCLCVLCGL
jgi:hypothetical protein